MPKTVLTVFLSSTAVDLQPHREAVYDRLRRINFLRCVRMEDFGSLDADVVKACRDGVEESDLFVGLVGMRRGWEPPGDPGQRSITEMEHDWAEAKQTPRFLHVSPDNFPVPGNLRETDDQHQRLLAFRKRIKSGRVVTEKHFENVETLSSFAVENLLTQIIRDPVLTQTIQGNSGSTDLAAAKLMIAADATGISEAAAYAGVGNLAIFELARRIKPDEDIDFDQAMKELAAAVDTAIEVTRQGRGGNLDDLVQETLGRIAEKTKAGDFESGARIADDAFAKWQKEEEIRQRDEVDRRERSVQSGVALLNAGLEQDILRRDAPSAAGKVRQIVALEHQRSDHATQFKALCQRQDEFYVRGRDKGINIDLSIAIQLARLTLDAATGPHERGITLNDLGNALTILGRRDSGTARLEEAIEAYRAALAERTRDRVPLDWAMTQNNLGSALQALGQRGSGTTRLKQAVEALSAALTERTRDRVPLDWAMTQTNLGNALGTLGERESGTARLEEAVEAYRAALSEYTRDRVPLDWAVTQTNLGNALRILGERESGTARLEQAIEAYRAALTERTRNRVPLDWAMTQNNLGAALSSLGERESDNAHLEEAVVAYRAALMEYTRDRVPLDWAATQNNLGTALQNLGQRENGTARLEGAVNAYSAALMEFTRGRVPLKWAATQSNLGNAFAILGQRESSTSRLEQAVDAYRAALLEYTRDRVPLDWARTQNNLGNALRSLGERESGTAYLEQAVEAFSAALEVFKEAKTDFYVQVTERNLANAVAILAERRWK